MDRMKWVAFTAPPTIVITGSLFLWSGGNDSELAENYVFARQQGIDCEQLDAAPPMTILPSGTSDYVLRTAMKEAWEITEQNNTNTEIAAIACGRANEMFGGILDPEDTLDVHLGLRRDSQNPGVFARAITSILVEKPEWQEPMEIEGGYAVLGEIRVN